MGIQDNFNRRIKAVKDVSDEEDSTSPDPRSSITGAPNAFLGESISSEKGSNFGSELDSGDGSQASGEGIATISFGALAKAQDSLGKRKRGHHGAIADPTRISPTRDIGYPEAAERKAGRSDSQEHARSSKHAPAEMSAKRAVSRRREVVPTVKRDVRDPRFEPLTGPSDPEKARRNYGFLDDYRDSEMSELKSAIRQTKDPIVKEKLKRALLRMESRKKTQHRKDEEQGILRAHRAKEKELIKQGKKPFYLKKAEQKKLALVQRFEGMKGKQVDKAIERRRKKKVSRELRDMPKGRRTIDGTT